MKKISRGQSLLEVIIALGLFAISAGTIFVLLGGQFKSLEVVKNSTGAIFIAEEGIEAVRSIRDRDWDELIPGTYGLEMINDQWTLSANPDVSNGYTRTIEITNKEENERLVTSTINWTPSFLREQTFSLTSIFSNWRNLVEEILAGDWSNPQTLGSVDLGPGVAATSLAVRNKIVYLTGIASDRKKHDFFIVDATDGMNPVVISSLDTGRGLNSIAIEGNYAYVVGEEDDNQLQIIDISNVNNPFFVSSEELDGDDGLSVAISGQYAFVGTEEDDEEFFVVDVSNVYNPNVLGSLVIDEDVNDIFIFKDRVLLATARDSREFIVVNVDDPYNPFITSYVDIPGGSEDGAGIYANSQDDKVYLARTVGGDHDNHHEIAVIDASSIDSPVLLGSLDFGADVNSVFVADDLGFFATSFSNDEFQIFNVSDPSNITSYASLNFSQVASDIAFEDNIIYLSVRSNDALRIITSE